MLLQENAAAISKGLYVAVDLPPSSVAKVNAVNTTVAVRGNWRPVYSRAVDTGSPGAGAIHCMLYWQCLDKLLQRYREHGLAVVQPLLPAIMTAVTNYKPYLPYRTETTVRNLRSRSLIN